MIKIITYLWFVLSTIILERHDIERQGWLVLSFYYYFRIIYFLLKVCYDNMLKLICSLFLHICVVDLNKTLEKLITFTDIPKVLITC